MIHRGATALWLAAASCCGGAAEQPAPAEAAPATPEATATESKFTAGRYASSDGNDATDLNLRVSHGPNTGWIGVYRDRAGLRQWRWGYERHQDGDRLRTVWSLQNASGGAWVASVSTEIGGSNYAIAGFGRTNLRNYVNLNYDPNDAVTWGVGTRALRHAEVALFQVRDDRLGTGQRVTHLLAKLHDDDSRRLTLDLSRKQGLDSDGETVRAWSCGIGWDQDGWFVRFVHDPYAGFGTTRQDRLSAGLRF